MTKPESARTVNGLPRPSFVSVNPLRKVGTLLTQSTMVAELDVLVKVRIKTEVNEQDRDETQLCNGQARGGAINRNPREPIPSFLRNPPSLISKVPIEEIPFAPFTRKEDGQIISGVWVRR